MKKALLNKDYMTNLRLWFLSSTFSKSTICNLIIYVPSSYFQSSSSYLRVKSRKLKFKIQNYNRYFSVIGNLCVFNYG